MDDNKKYLKPWQFFTFGLGNAGSMFSNNFMASFIVLFISYYYLNMNTAVVGTLMLLARIFDGISDIIFGNIMDRTANEKGKAKPWILRCAIPLGICGILIFFIPNTAVWAQYAYFFIFYFLYSVVFFTIINLSWTTMTALITKNNSERVKIGVVSYFVVLAVQIIISSVTLGIVDALGNHASAWRLVMIFYTIIGTVMLIISALTVKELPLYEEKDNNQITEKIGFIDGFRFALKNPYFVWSILFSTVNMLIITACTGLNLYYCQINLNDINKYSVISLITYISAVPGLLLAPAVVKKLGVYRTNLYSSLLSMIASFLIIPAIITKNTLLLEIALVVRYVPMGVTLASSSSVIPMVSEYSYKQTGRHIEGIIFSAGSMGNKIANGIAAALPGWILALVHFDSTLEVQNATTVTQMAIWFCVLPIVVFVMVCIIYAHLNVQKGLNELEAQQQR